MNRQQRRQEAKETPKTCAVCGVAFTHPGLGRYQDFCSVEHRNMGRAHCKQCGEPLIQGEKVKKDFCSGGLCQGRYYRARAIINPSLLEERNRMTCKCGCGKTFSQPKRGGAKQFYNESHGARYRRAVAHGMDLSQPWGGYGPETRKVLYALQNTNQMGLAQQLANAIDREYMLRVRIKKEVLITYHCKKCKREFRRQVNSLGSRDYCNECLKTNLRGENGPLSKLTYEQADEIKHLYVTQHLTSIQLAKMYGVCSSSILNIIHNRTYKPEDDPRRKAQ